MLLLILQLIGNVAPNPIEMPINAESTVETYNDSDDISELSEFVPDPKKPIFLSGLLIYLIWKLKAFSNSFYFFRSDPNNSSNEQSVNLNPEDELDRASTVNNWVTVEAILKNGVTPSTNVLCRAYIAGKSEIVSYILNRMEELNFTPNAGSILASKSCRGLMDVMMAENHIKHVDDKLLFLACRYGHLSLVAYILKVKPFELSKSHIDLAILSGNTRLVSFFVDKFKMTPGADALDIACYSRNVNLLRYLEEHFEDILDLPSLPAVIFDSQVLKYFVQEKSYPVTDYLFKQTAMYGYFESFEFLENNYPFHADNTILDAACFSGNLSFVKYLVEERNIEPNLFTLDSAVINNQLKVVKYLMKTRKMAHDLYVEKIAQEGKSEKLIRFLKSKHQMPYYESSRLEVYWLRRKFHSYLLKRQTISFNQCKNQLKRLAIT